MEIFTVIFHGWKPLIYHKTPSSMFKSVLNMAKVLLTVLRIQLDFGEIL